MKTRKRVQYFENIQKQTSYHLAFWMILFLLLVGFSPFSKKNEIIAKGNKQFQEHDYQNALISYEEFLKDHTQYPEAYYNKGSTQFFLGEYDAAIQSFSKSLGAKDPVIRTEAQRAIGNTYLQLQQFDQAIEAYKQALLQNPLLDSAKRGIEIARELKRRAEEAQKNQKSQDDTDNNDNKDNKSKENSDSKSDEKNNTQNDEKAQNKEQQKQESDTQKNQKPENQPDQPNSEQNQNQDQQAPSPQNNQNSNEQASQAVQAQPTNEQEKDNTQNQNTIDILNALQENEKQFQLYLFQQPKTQKRAGQKDW